MSPWYPSKVGEVYRSTRTKTGRTWRVASIDPGERGEGGYRYYLIPMGDDVVHARSDQTGRWQGGVRGIRRTDAELDDPKRWERVHG